MRHEECPMAVTLREGRAAQGSEAVAERPDGTRVPFAPYPSLLRNASGRVIGAINLLIDLTDRDHAELGLARLAAIVAFSDDALISKTLKGRITSWTARAVCLLGSEEDATVGPPLTARQTRSGGTRGTV